MKRIKLIYVEIIEFCNSFYRAQQKINYLIFNCNRFKLMINVINLNDMQVRGRKTFKRNG